MRPGRFTSINLVIAVSAVAAVVTPAASGLSATALRPPLVSSAHGIEVRATHTQGTFTGLISGALSGSWYAVVKHTPLRPNARITGGTLTLNTTVNGRSTTLRGHFARGAVTNTNPGANCANQTFKVVGDLVSVAGPGTHKGTGLFAVTLTHHRAQIFGSCVTYFATTSGKLTLSL
jgi:hypothetical protein